MNVLIYTAGTGLGCSTGQHLDMAIEEVKKGNKVFLLSCDNSIGHCICNPGVNPLYCRMCVHFQKADINKYAPIGIEHHWMSEYVSTIDKNTLPKLVYNNYEELKTLKFNGIEIGLGVMSTYITLTRNLAPKIDDESRKYFDTLIEEQLITLSVIEKLHKENRFDLVIFQNGRGAQFKPFLNFCQREGIDFWCTEDFGYSKTHNFTDNFWNSTPHEISGRAKLYRECWESSSDTEEQKELIARSFYENRRHSKPAADKVYTGNQVEGLLPENWDKQVENIVIFNSSEDEFAAVNKEFDDQALFPSQLDGLKQILEHYKDDNTKHFTLRIHPNLMKIPYKYHKDLYKLSYPNLTVVAGDSPISSYSLLDAANKIIVFGSTMGIEASYWGKPVICLAAALYRDLDVVYLPHTTQELWQLIDNKQLPSKDSYHNALVYSYYYMGDNHERTKNITIDVYVKKIFNKQLRCFKFQKLFGSNFLYSLLVTCFDHYFRMRYPAIFKTIPRDEQ